MIILKKILRQNRIKIHTITLQIAPIKKKILGGGGHAPKPP